MNQSASNKNLTSLTIAAIAIALLLLGAFGFLAYQTQVLVDAVGEERPLTIIRYANFRVYDPVYIAIDKGFFRDNGVEVQILGDTLGGPTAIQAVASGRADAGLSSIPALINANAAGLPVQGVADIQSALPEQPLETYYVRCDSGFDSIEDIIGQSFAVNLWYSSFHYTAIMALEQKGFVEEDVPFVLLPFGDQASALAAGEVDVIGLMQPYSAQAEAVYGDTICPLFDASDVFGTKQFSLIFTNRIWAENNPEAATGFATAIAQASAWIMANQDEARVIVSFYTGIDAEYVPDYFFQENGAVIETDIQFWIDYLIARGDVTATWLNPSDIGTNRYNQLVPQGD